MGAPSSLPRPAPPRHEALCSPEQRDVTRAVSAPLEVRLVMSPKLDVVVSPVSISMSDPTGVTWSTTFRQPFGRRLGDSPPEMEAYGWFTEPGRYRMQVFLNAELSAQVDLELSGQEEALTVKALVDSRESTGQPWIGALRATRVLPPPSGVVLRRAWNPTPDGTPKYELHNGAETILQSVVEGEPISGVVQRWEEGRWIMAPRGGVCGTDGGSSEDVPPGASLAIEEAPFTQRPMELLPGRYRYLVEYGSECTMKVHPVNRSDREITQVEVLSTYRSTDTFETAWEPTEWVRWHKAPLPACEYRGALYDGRLRIAVAGTGRPAVLYGVETESPPSDALLLLLDRHGLNSWRNPPCEIREDGGAAKVKVLVEQEGTLLDLAEVVLMAGHARVLPGDFPERARYLEIERRARAAAATPPGSSAGAP
jgi:hypothetical protein